MQILLTGGTGYLGQEVVKVLSGRYAVRLLVRDRKRASSLEPLNRVSLVSGDVRDRGSLKEAVKGCEAVFHLAALVKNWVPAPSLFEAVNVEGFRNVAEAAWQEGVQRFIYTSSFIALGPTDGTAQNRVFHNAYESSKTKALALAREYQKKGCPLLTVIPTVLYGPGVWTEGNHLSQILKALLAGHFPGWIDGGRWRWNFAYLEDVAQGHPLVFEKGKSGEEYLLGGEIVTLHDFFNLAAALSGVSLPARELPVLLLKAYAALQESLAPIFSRTPSITRGVLQLYRHDWAPTDEKARRELGYTTTPLETALAKTIDWLKHP